jgi:hypothetical protein
MSLPDLSEIWGSQVSIYRKLSGVHLKFKCILKVGDCERTTDYRSQIRDQLFKSNLTFGVVCVFTPQKCGAFTIDSSTPTLRRNLNEYPIHFYFLQSEK